MIMLGCLVLAVIMGVGGLWFVFGAGGERPAAPTSAEAEKLHQRGAQKSAEMRAAASALKQKSVGEGYEFDSDGRLIGATADATDLPINQTVDGLSTREQQDLTREIRTGIRRGPAADPGTEPHRGRDDTGPAFASGQIADRGLLTQSMLAYSTIDTAAWAERRPEAGRRSGDRPEGPPPDPETRDGRADDRMLNMMERLQEGMLAEGASSGGPVMEPRLPGERLYPAASSPQAFARGGVGDMRIAPGPGVLVRQGKFLDCALVNELRVDLAESPVIAMVTRNFLTGDGEHVLVPAGAKLLGTAGAVQSVQQARVYIRFDRVIFPDQRSAHFPVRQVGAVDGRGGIGIAGDVDRHLFLQFGAAVMLGVLDGLVAAGAQGPTGPGTPARGDVLLGHAGSSLGNVIGGVLQRYANVVPTVTVAPGATLKVFFAEDVRMSTYQRSSDLSWKR
jgi:type IV secretory pathway VirB10-like protein